MNAITKTWLRQQHRKTRSEKSFRHWARTDGKALVENVVESTDGVNHAVSKLTGVKMSPATSAAHESLLKAQKARKDRARVVAAATRKCRRDRSSKSSNKSKK